jgi:hypothetical protein
MMKLRPFGWQPTIVEWQKRDAAGIREMTIDRPVVVCDPGAKGAAGLFRPGELTADEWIAFDDYRGIAAMQKICRKAPTLLIENQFIGSGRSGQNGASLYKRAGWAEGIAMMARCPNELTIVRVPPATWQYALGRKRGEDTKAWSMERAEPHLLPMVRRSNKVIREACSDVTNMAEWFWTIVNVPGTVGAKELDDVCSAKR